MPSLSYYSFFTLMAVSVSDSYQSKIIHPSLTLFFLYLQGHELPAPGEAAGQAGEPEGR